mgnify:CR=1 FL=1|jgi:RND family efflux transporter MFP subunit
MQEMSVPVRFHTLGIVLLLAYPQRPFYTVSIGFLCRFFAACVQTIERIEIMTLCCPKRKVGLLPLLVLLPLLTACGDDETENSGPVRAIRTVTVSEPASGKMRRYSGVVEAAVNSSISFEVSGSVQAVNVDVGERITEGQVLAALDEQVHQLNVSAAQAAVGGAEVQVADARSALERLQGVAARNAGFVSLRDMEQAQAVHDGARKNLDYSVSRLNLARRDLERTRLRAPLDGVIAQRHVDPFQEVNRGEPMFDLFVEGAMQASIGIPESEIDQIALGLQAQVRFPAISGAAHKAVVTEISKVAGTANAFPVKLTVAQHDEDVRIRPGITAEVSLLLGDNEDEGAYLIPIAAIIPGVGEEKHVFVFDPATSTVKLIAIEDGGIRDSNIIVSKGLSAGDIVAVAGVSFLRDGQKVRLMQPQVAGN